MEKYSKDDYIREFELEHNRCNSYFDNMYKVLQFSFATIIAIIVAAASLFNKTTENIESIRAIILGYILPVFTYVFGVMYAYNAYALTVCGKRAELLHKKIYSSCNCSDDIIEETEETKRIIEPYIFTKRTVTFFSYGLQLMFYVAFPLTCNIFSILLCNPKEYYFFYNVLHFILTGLYLIIMAIIIAHMCSDFAIKQNDSSTKTKKITESKKHAKSKRMK